MSDSLGASRRRAGRVVAWAFGGVLVVVVASAAWIGVRGMLAADHLLHAQDAASALRSDLTDTVAVSDAIDTIAADTAAARSLTTDPVWSAAETLPWIGPQLAAVRTVAVAADDVAGTALRPLADAAAGFSVDMLRPVDGAIDVSVLAGLREAAETGRSGVSRAATAVDGVDDDALLPALREPIVEVKDLLHEVETGADALARASALVPAMLGADGPRNYLVVFQNNAEWRSLGGIVGAMAVVSTDGGRLTLSAQGSSSDFRRYDEPVVPLDSEVLGVYGRRPALFVQNATQVADFALAGTIMREMWQRETGTAVDGVVSLDPVALSYLLAATGPVELPSGDVLTEDNAVALLLNEVYQRYEEPADQDAFFQATAAAVFAALSSGSADPARLLEAFARAGDEDRLLLWSAHSDEQAILDGTTLQGGLPVTDEQTTSFGVYLNDGTGSKMDYYLTPATATGWCRRDDGEVVARLSVQLRNDAPSDAATLPDYITGGGVFGVSPGTANTIAYVYLPTGAELVDASASGSGNAPGFGGGTHAGHQVLTWTTDLAPGESATLDVLARTPATPVLDVRISPTVNADETSELASACEIPQ